MAFGSFFGFTHAKMMPVFKQCVPYSCAFIFYYLETVLRRWKHIHAPIIHQHDLSGEHLNN